MKKRVFKVFLVLTLILAMHWQLAGAEITMAWPMTICSTGQERGL